MKAIPKRLYRFLYMNHKQTSWNARQFDQKVGIPKHKVQCCHSRRAAFAPPEGVHPSKRLPKTKKMEWLTMHTSTRFVGNQQPEIYLGWTRPSFAWTLSSGDFSMNFMDQLWYLSRHWDDSEMSFGCRDQPIKHLSSCPPTTCAEQRHCPWIHSQVNCPCAPHDCIPQMVFNQQDIW